MVVMVEAMEIGLLIKEHQIFPAVHERVRWRLLTCKSNHMYTGVSGSGLCPNNCEGVNCLSELLSSWCFVIVALANEYVTHSRYFLQGRKDPAQWAVGLLFKH